MPKISITNFKTENQRLELVSEIAHFAKCPGVYETPIPGLKFHRREAPTLTEPSLCFYEPALAIVAQGAKRVQLANETYTYDQANYLLTSIDLPVSSCVTQASTETPYLSLSLGIDLRHVGELMVEAEAASSHAISPCRGLSVSRVSMPLLDCTLRLVRLLHAPGDIAVLAPLIKREIVYRVLIGEQGPRLRHMATPDSWSHQIVKVIGWLKKNYACPLRIDELAHDASMSVSSLHHHFKAITAMSPLQFQKQIRLQEARRLMVAGTDAANAGHLVGYESPSHFSRDYSRIYGAPPLRDIAHLRKQAE